jgi:hypothetical protein
MEHLHEIWVEKCEAICVYERLVKCKRKCIERVWKNWSSRQRLNEWRKKDKGSS